MTDRKTNPKTGTFLVKPACSSWVQKCSLFCCTVTPGYGLYNSIRNDFPRGLHQWELSCYCDASGMQRQLRAIWHPRSALTQPSTPASKILSLWHHHAVEPLSLSDPEGTLFRSQFAARIAVMLAWNKKSNTSFWSLGTRSYNASKAGDTFSSYINSFAVVSEI